MSIQRPVFPAYDLGLQYEVMASIGRHSDIPVPELRGLELERSDAPGEPLAVWRIDELRMGKTWRAVTVINDSDPGKR